MKAKGESVGIAKAFFPCDIEIPNLYIDEAKSLADALFVQKVPFTAAKGMFLWQVD